MKLLQEKAFLFALVGVGVLLPVQANASAIVIVPEPVTLTLLVTGLAGLGAAEIIRRRKNK
jgi:hypothetical protein